MQILADSLERKAWRLAIWGKTRRIRCLGDFLYILYYQYRDIDIKWKDYEDLDWIPEDIKEEIIKDFNYWVTNVANFLFITKDTCTSMKYEREIRRGDLEKFLNY